MCCQGLKVLSSDEGGRYMMKEKDVRNAIRDRYGGIAAGGSCCGPVNTNGCCSSADTVDDRSMSDVIGYSPEDRASVPQGADLGLGCGNPLAFTMLKDGDTVLDLGSGGGFDCFLAAKHVGNSGHVIGVDMTPAMVESARENAKKGAYSNVEFRLGEIENLPVADSSVNLIVSNCVINLSLDKTRVFREAYRALKPGGKLIVSDIVLMGKLPLRIQQSIDAYIGCISGAIQRDDYLRIIEDAGFSDVQVLTQKSFGADVLLCDPAAQSLQEEWNISDKVAEESAKKIISITITAIK
jgi:SAM-dependent methyltransferase